MKQKIIASWIFGGLSFLFLIGVFFFAPKELPEQNHRILGLMAAFSAGFLGYFMSGTLGIDGTATLKPFGKFAIKAGGGLALFILVLLWWSSDESPSRSVKALHSLDNKVTSLSEQVASSTEIVLKRLADKETNGALIHASAGVIDAARLLVDRGDKKQRAIAEIALGHSNAAQALLNELATDPVAEAAEILTLQGDNWYFAGQEDQAIVPYEKVLALRPDDPKALLNLGAAHAWAHLGDKSKHLRAAIADFEAASVIYKKEGELTQWAKSQHLLGDAWSEVTTGSPADNIGKAIEAYNEALTVRTKDAYPEAWARTEANLASSLLDLPAGNRAENIQRAIGLCEEAQTVLSSTDSPFEYAGIQTTLADAWSELPTGDHDENMKKAISLYEMALTIRTKSADRAEWALVESDLASAWSDLGSGDRTENLHKAIAGYEATLAVYTREDYPADWARTNFNLSVVCCTLAKISGQPKRDLFRKADELLRLSLSIWTESEFPNDHADATAQLALCESSLKELGPTVVESTP